MIILSASIIGLKLHDRNVVNDCLLIEFNVLFNCWIKQTHILLYIYDRKGKVAIKSVNI